MPIILVPSIDLGTQRVDYTIVRGTSRRQVYFRFRADMTLEVVVPRGKPVDVSSAVGSHREWILRTFREMSRRQRVLDGDSVMFDGKRLRLIVVEDHVSERIDPDPGSGTAVVHTSDRSRTRELVRRWFLKETSRYVVKRLAEFARDFGVRYTRADVREISSWGYCTRNGRLSFSWQLIALPGDLREYVICHELAHLSHFNHSRSFRARLGQLCPDYRHRERELAKIVPLETARSEIARF